MKRLFQITLILLLGLAMFNTSVSSQSWIASIAFLPTAGVSCGAGATVVNGTHFGSGIIRVSHPGYSTICAITVTFTRTGGTTSTVEFQFQASYDDGTTWTTAYYVRIYPATNTTAVSNVVRYAELINVHGISHLRLFQIVNNDGATALTACNATMSIGVAD